MALLDIINPYAYIMLARRWMYRRGWLKSEHPGIPVISIGNLSMGGSGKSPLVMDVAKYLIAQCGKRVAIVSRGYRRSSKGFVLVSDGKTILADVDSSGDEAQMFAQLVPQAIVIVDEDRVRGAKRAKALGAEIVVLDDGYQHLRIQRDLNILLVDTRRALSPVIPFGRFREPLYSAEDADVLVLSHAEDKTRTRRCWEQLEPNCKAEVIGSTLQTVGDALISVENNSSVELSTLRGRRVMAVSSVASPQSLIKMLEEAGAEVIYRNLGDHAGYSRALVETILRGAEGSGAEMIITTQKDIVKSREYFLRVESRIPVFVLSQKIEFLSGERSFYAAIERLL